MTCLKRFAACILVLGASVFSVSDAAGTDDFMVLRYSDGSTQKVRLERPSESIRQIEFVDGRRTFGRDDRGGDYIRVISATYGRNCGAPYGNATGHLADFCDGKGTCEYVIDVRVLGDPAAGCAKDFFAEWQCRRDSTKGTTSVRGEAGNRSTVVLRCPVR